MEEDYTFPNAIVCNILNVLKAQVTTALLVAIVLIVIYKLFHKNESQKIPGPIGLPFLGYWPFLTKDPHLALTRLAKKYGNFYGLYLGRKYAVVCNDYETVKEALGQTVAITRPVGIFSPIPNGTGFGSANVHDWSVQRRFCVKSMKDDGLGTGDEWEELLQEAIVEVISRLQSSQGRPIDADTVLGGTLTNIVMLKLFGYRLPYDEVQGIEETMTNAIEQSPPLDPCIFLPAIVNKLFYPRKFIDRIKKLSDYVQKCIEEKAESKQNLEQKKFVKGYFQKIQENKTMGLGNSFTDASLLRNTRTLIFGSRTTLKAFHWLLVAMAEYPEKQFKVHQELDAVLGKDHVLDRYADRTSVPYTFAAVLESMRWRTLVGINALRVFSEDTTLQGYKITKGTLLVTNFWAVHNDTRYWKNPELFEPERFLTADEKSVIFKPESFIPFSVGPRDCSAKLMAISGMLLYFAAIMQKFKILPEEEGIIVKEQYIGSNCAAVSRSVGKDKVKGVRLSFIARD
ncbi:hypothetical protein JTE90_009688 [Oedothorax gibbosus]|uniref:Cytochrome P450 n=1 Tax=Oedothorax gibbosus TaxID=931172 RepID=A0AAV6V9Y2_9ARAC|nr:hypothetical protein JTE90_009688 [Oedothorax gibbosus]